MKTKISLLFSAVLFCAVIYSCNSGSNEMSTDPTKAGVNITPEQLATKMDLVCGMDMSKSKISDTTAYNGGIYAFCSPHCKEAFNKEPEKYLSTK